MYDPFHGIKGPFYLKVNPNATKADKKPNEGQNKENGSKPQNIKDSPHYVIPDFIY